MTLNEAVVDTKGDCDSNGIVDVCVALDSACEDFAIRRVDSSVKSLAVVLCVKGEEGSSVTPNPFAFFHDFVAFAPCEAAYSLINRPLSLVLPLPHARFLWRERCMLSRRCVAPMGLRRAMSSAVSCQMRSRRTLHSMPDHQQLERGKLLEALLALFGVIDLYKVRKYTRAQGSHQGY